MTKQKITLTVDDEVFHQMKIQGATEKRSVSAITEELYREYLKRLKKDKK